METREIITVLKRDYSFNIADDEQNLGKTYEVKLEDFIKIISSFCIKKEQKLNQIIKNDVLLKTFITYQKVIQLMKDNPTHVIVETVDFSHGYEVTITVEDTTDPEKLFISPFWDTHEMTYLVATGIFKQIETWSSEDKTLSTRKYSLS